MKRRDFLKWSLAAPLCLEQLLFAQKPAEPIAAGGFEFFEAHGSYREIGYQIGHRFRKNIQAIIRRRGEWHHNLMRILQSKRGRAASAEYHRLTARHFPHLLEEIAGLADGAGISFDTIWAMTIKSELGALEKENPGCTTIVSNRPEHLWLFHNEDGHAAYKGFMFVAKAHPPSGVSFLALVYPGILTGNGPSLNSRGIVQTTNYIGSTVSAIGLPRYVIGRAVLEAKSLEEARQIVCLEPRAYPYHHNLLSFAEKRYLSVETTPAAAATESPAGDYCHTNHLLLSGTNNFPREDQEYKNSSSMSRYRVIGELLTEHPPAAAGDYLVFLSSHRRAPYSPCRHPQGDVQGQTLGTAFVDAEKAQFRLYAGNPCQSVPGNQFKEYRF